MTRKMASIRKIDAIKPIENADAIELAIIGGWQVVVKKGEFKPNTFAIYCEVDSWIPTELAPFLSKGKEPKEYNGVKGERLRTIKLRGQLSQGLLLPIIFLDEWQEGDDVSEKLGIQKWEAPVPAQLAGNARGNFPSNIPKTDQERIQNLSGQFDSFKGKRWQVTEKLHGSSMTVYLDSNNEFHVCSRNLDLKEDQNNSYWKMARMLDLENKMKEHNLQGYAIQGELIGEGINGNQYKKQLEFYVFDIFTEQYGYLKPTDVENTAEDLDLFHAPVLDTSFEIKSEDTVQSLLQLAEGKSKLNDSEREGFVFKSLEDPNLSFKVVSNKWLLSNE